MSREAILRLHKDPKTNALKNVNYEHSEIHAGEHYFVSGHEIEASAATIKFVVTTPNTTKWLHMTFSIDATEKVTLDVYEGTSGVTGGAAVTPANNNRNSANTSGATIVKDPASITVEGTLLDSYASGSTGPFGQIGNVSRDKELVLKQNTSYLFKITSGAAGNDISYNGSWYEHTNSDA